MKTPPRPPRRGDPDLEAAAPLAALLADVDKLAEAATLAAALGFLESGIADSAAGAVEEAGRHLAPAGDVYASAARALAVKLREKYGPLADVPPGWKDGGSSRYLLEALQAAAWPRQ